MPRSFGADKRASNAWRSIATEKLPGDWRRCAMSPDGNYTVLFRHTESPVTVYRSETGEKVQDLRTGSECGRFSPDGSWFAIGHYYGGGEVYRTSDWKHHGSFRGRFPAFSPDGKLLVVGDAHSTLQFIETSTLRTVAELEIQEQTSILPLAFTPDSAYLVLAASQPRRLLLLDVAGLRDDLRRQQLDWDFPALPARAAPAAVPNVRLFPDETTLLDGALDAARKAGEELRNRLLP